MAASNLCDSQLRNRKERRKEKEPVRSASPCLFVFFFCFCFCTYLSSTCIHFFFLFQIGDILWQQWLWKSHSTWQIVLLFPLKKRVMNTQLFFFFQFWSSASSVIYLLIWKMQRTSFAEWCSFACRSLLSLSPQLVSFSVFLFVRPFSKLLILCKRAFELYKALEKETTPFIPSLSFFFFVSPFSLNRRR